VYVCVSVHECVCSHGLAAKSRNLGNMCVWGGGDMCVCVFVGICAQWLPSQEIWVIYMCACGLVCVCVYVCVSVHECVCRHKLAAKSRNLVEIYMCVGVNMCVGVYICVWGLICVWGICAQWPPDTGTYM